MSDIAISVENICKQFRIGKRDPYRTVRETIMNTLSAPLRMFKKDEPDPEETFWALKDVSFDVKFGEVVGIIGRNGAGKSTLLKVLSRITKPTSGQAVINGRIGSLLEVGTGFHPELTGRENIYLNGAILGMKRQEIQNKFDEIVEFSEVQRFLDMPVKRYSSGMYTRLAFAVAAHLEPEVLVVDEVLAVGDAEFQKKCLGKMKDVAGQGRTVLFVSHNMRAVEQLCTSAVALKSGQVWRRGNDVRHIIQDYLRPENDAGDSTVWDNTAERRHANPAFTPLRMYLADENGSQVTGIQRGDTQLYLHIEFDVESYDPGLAVGYVLSMEDGQQLYWTYQTDTEASDWPKIHEGKCVLRTALPKRMLSEGRYRIELMAALFYRNWFLYPGQTSPSIAFEIQGGLTDSTQWMGRHGILTPVFKWETVE